MANVSVFCPVIISAGGCTIDASSAKVTAPALELPELSIVNSKLVPCPQFGINAAIAVAVGVVIVTAEVETHFIVLLSILAAVIVPVESKGAGDVFLVKFAAVMVPLAVTFVAPDKAPAIATVVSPVAAPAAVIPHALEAIATVPRLLPMVVSAVEVPVLMLVA
jgi:hypothetical protein